MLISAYDILELFQGQDKYLRSLSLAPLIDKWKKLEFRDHEWICST